MCAGRRRGQLLGDNSYGQLGDGTTTASAIPVAALGISGAVAVSSGGRHSFALLASPPEEVRCWGSNRYGQWGDATTANRARPILAVGLMMAIDVGASHSCAVSMGGFNVFCWGANDSGQLGDATTTDRLRPFAVPGVSTPAPSQLATGHTCAIVAPGAVSCWGANESGQLGDGTTTHSLAAITVTGISDAIAITAGAAHTCELLSGGSVRCWGRNGNGELGDGTTTNRRPRSR